MTSYIQIWLNNLVTVFGNAKQTNVEGIFAHEGTEVWKRENRPFRAFSSSIWNAKRMLTLEINKSEVERARLVKEAKFPVFLCTAEFNFTKPHLLKLC